MREVGIGEQLAVAQGLGRLEGRVEDVLGGLGQGVAVDEGEAVLGQRVAHGAGRAAGGDGEALVLDLGLVVRVADRDGGVLGRREGEVHLEAEALHAVRVEELVEVARAAHGGELLVLRLEDVARHREAAPTVREARLGADLDAVDGLGVGDGDEVAEEDAALHVRGAEAARVAGVELEVVVHVVLDGRVARDDRVVDVGGQRADVRAAEGGDQALGGELLLLEGDPQAADEGEPLGRLVGDGAEEGRGPRGLVLHGEAVERRAVRAGRAERVVGHVVQLQLLVEVEGAEGRVDRVRHREGVAQLLGELAVIGHGVRGLRREGDEAGRAEADEARARAAVHVAARVDLEALIARHGGQLAAPERRLDGDDAADAFEEAVVPGVLVVGLEVVVLDEAAAGRDDVGAEDLAAAVQAPSVHVEEDGEGVRRLDQELRAGRVLLELADALLDVGVVEVLGHVVAGLVEAGDPEADPVRDRSADRALDVHRVEGAVGGAQVAVELFRGPHALELDEARRRVAPEQRALRPAQHLDAVGVEDGEALERRVLQHDAVVVHADGLVRVEVEVRVAVAADVEAREGAPEGTLAVEARRAARQGEDAPAPGHDVVEFLRADHVHGQGHVLKALLRLGRGDDDLVHLRARGGGDGEREGGGAEGGGETGHGGS